ncbi:MAG: MarR family winged helix-turn-helix transcriptional regulator [Acidimicrobiales bacterium]
MTSDLSLSQYRVLGLLAEGIALPSSMADSLDVRRPSITAVVDGLVARRLVIREHDEKDRRKVTHSITIEGRSALGAADRCVGERLTSIAAMLGQHDLMTGALDGLGRWGPALIAWRDQKAREKQPS